MFLNRLSSGALFCVYVCVGCVNAQVTDQDIDRWLNVAKAGRPLEALSALRDVVAANPASLRAARDRVVVASWADAHEEALAAYAQLSGVIPGYVKAAAALSARRLGRFEQAEQLYRAQLVSEPNQREAQAGVVLSRLGAEVNGNDAAVVAARAEEAATLALGWLPQQRSARATREWVPLLEALAIVRERQRRYTEALTAWQTLLQAAPDSTVARRALLFVASRLGAASVAESLVSSVGSGLDEVSRLRVRQDGTATAIRWGEVQADVDTAVARFGWTNRGLSSNLTDRALAPVASSLSRNAAFDRMIALRDRVLMLDAIKLYRSLVDSNIELPAYVIVAAADAYLYERQPAIARDLYRSGIALDQAQSAGGKPNREWQFSLMWALLECEQWQETHDLVAQLWSEARTATKLADPEPAEFTRLTRASVVQALVRLYADELRPAHALLSNLRDLAPHSLSIRAAYAAWLQSNGMRFQSNELLRQTLAEDPDYLTARIALADSEFNLSRFASTRERVAKLAQEYPESRAVQRSQDTLVMHDAPELKLAASLGSPRGDRVATRERRIDATLYSPPIYENYRAFVHVFDAVTGTDAGSAHRSRVGVGAELRREGLDMSLELHGDTRPNSQRAGVALQLSLWPSDLWRVRAGVDTNTLDIPLRATQAGVFARQLSLELSSRYAYLRGATLGINAYRFSDGNNRLNLAASWQQRLIEGPVYRLDGNLSAYASSNSRSDVPYFSPRRDASVEATLTSEWRTWRFYESSFMQRLAVSAGEYWQQSYGGLPTLAARYEHEWEGQRNYVLRYGVSWSRRPFDGQQESRIQGYFDIDWRLR